MKKIILDASCGGRMMWFNKKHPRALYMDIREAPKGIVKERPNFNVKPDMIADFRALPFKDKSFKLVVWDPPHLKSLTKTSMMRKKYGSLDKWTWREDLVQGFDECYRVLEDYGILIFKWSQAKSDKRSIPLNKVLKLFSIQPLFGHSMGSKSQTFWLCFMRIPKQDQQERLIKTKNLLNPAHNTESEKHDLFISGAGARRPSREAGRRS